ncbi:site-specific recombinase XerD [Paraburkholderia sp. HC6.4b]|uniref:tyrosine-type recombinase/integrase n=1 Tax=unclassified Paraburkholderia TaxID=2615204 RepID=UPI0016128538|nr:MULTISPECIES: tyrosine-type recombinase/integrase [unclassified Paraburkholderia]MBB5413402.1 site-specific recombinase XerD [Paraburkholderia sp. HC6.4b]MBB5455683.1 site-specific recombinase XerD [Paraburkholderia sp. Kb1A]
MKLSDWIDLQARPPRPLPDSLEATLDYLSSALGTPVYTRWTPARLMARFDSMRQAKAALPEVFELLIVGECAVQFWQYGEVVTLPLEQAPSAERVIERLLRLNRTRFQPAGAAALDRARGVPGEQTRATGHRRRIDEEPWLAAAGRFVNLNAATNTLSALNDASAVAAFIRDRTAASNHTRRSYLVEIRRLIRWCEPRGVGPLSDLTREVLLDYQEHLSRDTPLVQGSREHAMSVIQSLFSYLLKTGYLTVNPAFDLRSGHRDTQGFDPGRILPAGAARACDDWLRAQLSATAKTPQQWRRATIFAVYRFTGVRLDELASRDGYPRLRVECGDWTLTVLGKGRKPRSIPLPDDCVAFLKHYRRARGLSPEQSTDDDASLFYGRRGGKLGTSGLYREVKAAFLDILSLNAHANLADKLALQRASTHWLRHFFAKVLVVDERVTLSVAQELLGHANVNQTASYARVDQSDLRKVMKRLHLPPAST